MIVLDLKRLVNDVEPVAALFGNLCNAAWSRSQGFGGTVPLLRAACNSAKSSRFINWYPRFPYMTTSLGPSLIGAGAADTKMLEVSTIKRDMCILGEGRIY